MCTWQLKLCRAAAAGAVLGLAQLASAIVPAYSLVDSFTFAAGAWDVRSDGRLIGLAGNTILVQDAVNGLTSSAIGSIDSGLIAPWGASFVRISPGGTKLAIGDNGSTASSQTYLLNTADLSLSGPITPVGVTATNYAATWETDSRLYVAGGVFGFPAQITRIDASGSPTATQVVSNGGGASGGVAINAGWLYAGVGFDGFGSVTGDIRRFDCSILESLGAPLNYLGGIFATNALSVASLDFDSLGNMIIGGAGSIAVINPTTLERIDLTPGSPDDFYMARYNAATGEILVQGFFDPAIYRYAIPAPASVFPAAILGVFTFSRRKR